jgi:hypothetical protein
MTKRIEAPVLLIIFNRPETTLQVFNAIREAKPKKLYISADGPRPGNISDINTCIKAREIVKQIDWECEVHYRFLDQNIGCGTGPSSAISWIFENEERAIILEDDCVPAQAFFWYCYDLLERYKDDTRVMVISGSNWNEERKRNNDSYFFSRFGSSTGWGTWKRVWNYFDYDMKLWPQFKMNRNIQDIFKNKAEIKYFTKAFDYAFASHKDSWDYQFLFTVWGNGGLNIFPASNLVSNIGVLGTHSNSSFDFHFRPVNENFKIQKHPDFILPNSYYDEYHFTKHWKKMRRSSIFTRILRKLIKVIRIKN